MMVAMFLVFGIFFVIVPAIWIFFYGSRHVKATCEARDPVIRWTDACPLPVLGLCLWYCFRANDAGHAIAGHGVMPFFGMFLTGLPGTLFVWSRALWAYAAWLLYQLMCGLVVDLDRILVVHGVVCSDVCAARHTRDVSTDGLPTGAIDQ